MNALLSKEGGTKALGNLAPYSSSGSISLQWLGSGDTHGQGNQALGRRAPHSRNCRLRALVPFEKEKKEPSPLTQKTPKLNELLAPSAQPTLAGGGA